MVGPGLRDFLEHVKFIAKTEIVLGPLGPFLGYPRNKNYILERMISLSYEKKKRSPC